MTSWLYTTEVDPSAMSASNVAFKVAEVSAVAEVALISTPIVPAPKPAEGALPTAASYNAWARVFSDASVKVAKSMLSDLMCFLMAAWKAAY